MFYVIFCNIYNLVPENIYLSKQLHNPLCIVVDKYRLAVWKKIAEKMNEQR